ncbi:Uncharacterised protein [uncultured archaeon]|nr:Uncharacterised protein [uncultured archaeon]
MKIIRTITHFLIAFLFLIISINFSLALNTTSSAYLQINDIYTFSSNGNFERDSNVWLTHNDEYERKDLRFSQIFPNYLEEKHKILSNITYNLYWGNCLTPNQTIIREPEKDFKKDETIADVISLGRGEQAHYIRSYSSYLNPQLIDLSINLDPIPVSKVCENISCGEYKLSYFYTTVRIEKSKCFGLCELEVENKLNQPDMIYDDGKYRVYLWKTFSLDMGDFKQKSILFSYSYPLANWAFWSLFSLAIGLVGGYFTSHYFFNKDRIVKE